MTIMLFIINEKITEEMNKLKNLPGKDIWLYGGASLITTFINLGLEIPQFSILLADKSK